MKNSAAGNRITSALGSLKVKVFNNTVCLRSRYLIINSIHRGEKADSLLIVDGSSARNHVLKSLKTDPSGSLDETQLHLFLRLLTLYMIFVDLVQNRQGFSNIFIPKGIS